MPGSPLRPRQVDLSTLRSEHVVDGAAISPKQPLKRGHGPMAMLSESFQRQPASFPGPTSGAAAGGSAPLRGRTAL